MIALEKNLCGTESFTFLQRHDDQENNLGPVENFSAQSYYNGGESSDLTEIIVDSRVQEEKQGPRLQCSRHKGSLSIIDINSNWLSDSSKCGSTTL